MTLEDKILRDLIIKFLSGETHMGFDEAVKDFPQEFINTYPPRVSYSVWQLLEHIRFSQKDILDFIGDPNYQEPDWPLDYWQDKSVKADSILWDKTITSIKNDTHELINMVLDPMTDLYAKIPWGTGQTIIEELLKVADHNSYHIGEFASLRQVMETWPKSRI
jgi:hypothetical protein